MTQKRPAWFIRRMERDGTLNYYGPYSSWWRAQLARMSSSDKVMKMPGGFTTTHVR